MRRCSREMTRESLDACQFGRLLDARQLTRHCGLGSACGRTIGEADVTFCAFLFAGHSILFLLGSTAEQYAQLNVER